MPKKIYLAGPEVFLRNPMEQAEKKRAICARYGFEGAFPMDTKLTLSIPPGPKDGLIVSRADEAMMDDCDLIVANMTPFRGPSMDVGTAFEMGYMRAQGKPVFGYSNVVAKYRERVTDFFGGKVALRPGDKRVLEDPDGNMLESFEMEDNLMMVGAVMSGGTEVITVAVPHADRYTHLRAFELCVKAAKERLG
jgi:nucleoside 2-deoxyribosyltransferase